MAFMDAVMVKSFAALAQGANNFTAETGLRAAQRLRTVLDAHASAPNLTEIRDAVNKITPQSDRLCRRREITAKLTDSVRPQPDARFGVGEENADSF